MKIQQILRMACATLLAGILTINSAYAANNVSLFYGSKSLDDVSWQPVEDQQEIGFMLDFQFSDLPLSVAFDYLASDDTGVFEGDTYKGETTELHLGIRQYIDEGKTLVPYIGGGVAAVEGKYSGRGRLERDEATGIWVGIGFNWMLSKEFHIGADFRFSSAELTLFNKEVDGGGVHLGATAGFSF